MGRKELQAALDFILNGADEAEFEVLVKAVERRLHDARFMPSGSGSPARMATEMAASISRGVGATMEGLRETVRGYVEELVRSAAPGIGEKELAVLLDHWGAGDGGGGKGAMKGPGDDVGEGAAPASLPPDVLFTMVRQFVSYSVGSMPPSEQKYLWQEMPRWQEEYWKAFPPEMKALIDGLLKGKIVPEEFWPAIKGLLGL